MDLLEPQVSFQHPRSGAWFPITRNFAAGTEGRDINVATAPITEAASCSLENYLVLPDHSMDDRIRGAKHILGRECVILGHHYQRDEVVRFADYRGDSYRLSQMAAQAEGRYIVFCGVHFMAESADILARAGQSVVLPDLNAGCSMADMAEIGQVEDAWEQFVNLGLTDDEGHGITPITYMNSTAAIKAFCGERGGMVCTSSNAKGAFDWAFRRNEKIFFLPDQHLGRNTGFARGIPLDEMVVWDPYQLQGGLTADRLRKAKVILWKGHCSVHQRFLPEHVDKVRATYPGMQVIVHPECRWEVCQKADGIGSTDYLIRRVQAGACGKRVRHRHRNSPDQPPGQGESRISTSLRSTIPAAFVLPCFASRRSTCAGRWRTWWRARWSIRSR